MIFTEEQIERLPGSVVETRDGCTVTVGARVESENKQRALFKVWGFGYFVYANLAGRRPEYGLKGDIVEVLKWADGGTDDGIDGDSTSDKIEKVTRELCRFLQAKNRAYGDSATDPVRIFSKASPQEGMRVRIDDKLSRLARGGDYPGDNDILDLAGYLVLMLVDMGWEGE